MGGKLRVGCREGSAVGVEVGMLVGLSCFSKRRNTTKSGPLSHDSWHGMYEEAAATDASPSRTHSATGQDDSAVLSGESL